MAQTDRGTLPYSPLGLPLSSWIKNQYAGAPWRERHPFGSSVLADSRGRATMTITFGNATVQRLYFERQLAERLNHLRFYTITECLVRMHHGHAFPDIADWLQMSLRTV